MEHWFEWSWFPVGLAVKVLDLEEVVTIIKVVSYKVTDKFLNHQSLINFHILVKTGDK